MATLTPPSPCPPPRKEEGEPSPPMRGRGQGEGGAGAPVKRASKAITTSQRADAQAKRLRRRPAYAETLLWRELRKLEFEGTHWRRRVAIGPYIVDFVCFGRRLIVELEGGVHHLPSVQKRDESREIWLRDQGFAVRRFGNEVVVQNRERVIHAISTTPA